MAEYIEREAYIRIVKDIPMWGSVAAMMADAIPAADVEPVRHGRWELCGENSTGDVFLCSNCKFPHNPNKRDVGLARVMEAPNFCPMCGAKMDGESDA